MPACSLSKREKRLQIQSQTIKRASLMSPGSSIFEEQDLRHTLILARRIPAVLDC